MTVGQRCWRLSAAGGLPQGSRAAGPDQAGEVRRERPRDGIIISAAVPEFGQLSPPSIWTSGENLGDPSLAESLLTEALDHLIGPPREDPSLASQLRRPQRALDDRQTDQRVREAAVQRTVR